MQRSLDGEPHGWNTATSDEHLTVPSCKHQLGHLFTAARYRTLVCEIYGRKYENDAFQEVLKYDPSQQRDMSVLMLASAALAYCMAWSGRPSPLSQLRQHPLQRRRSLTYPVIMVHRGGDGTMSIGNKSAADWPTRHDDREANERRRAQIVTSDVVQSLITAIRTGFNMTRYTFRRTWRSRGEREGEHSDVRILPKTNGRLGLDGTGNYRELPRRTFQACHSPTATLSQYLLTLRRIAKRVSQ